MTERNLSLGEVIRRVMDADGATLEAIAAADERLSQRLDAAATRTGLDRVELMREAVGTFLNDGDDGLWATAMSRMQDGDDPARAFLRVAVGNYLTRL